MTTETIKATAVRRGDRIWAPDDGDWLRVDRISNDEVEVTFYRLDHSEATFRPNSNVLRQVPAVLPNTETGSGT